MAFPSSAPFQAKKCNPCLRNSVTYVSGRSGLGIPVALVQIVEHGFFQYSNGSVTASTHTALGHLCEESLYKVEPAAAGRREVNVIARVSRQPTSNLGDLVCAVVVYDQMHVQPGGKIVSISLRNRKNS